jgi:hypothetical protein
MTLPASTSDTFGNLTQRHRAFSTPIVTVNAGGVESRYVDLTTFLRTSQINMGITIQVVGTTVTPYLTLMPATQQEVRLNPSGIPWTAFPPVNAGSMYNFGFYFGVYLRLDFAGAGQVIVSAL